MNVPARLIGISLLLTSLSISMPALAVDGVIEINQAKVAIGGITLSDLPGFPATIVTAGHYRLTSNLVINEAQRAIDIEVDNVTIDLNGFSIIGPITCQAGTNTCVPITSVRAGIDTHTGTRNITIKNGTIIGVESGISCYNTEGCVVSNINVNNNRAIGIRVGPKSRVSNCSIQINGGHGIQAFASSFIENNVISFNGGSGLTVVGDGVSAVTNTFYRNGGREIDMNSYQTAIGGNTFNPVSAGLWFYDISKMTEISPNVCIDGSTPYTNCTGL